jgi:hypothetical protein
MKLINNPNIVDLTEKKCVNVNHILLMSNTPQFVPIYTYICDCYCTMKFVISFISCYTQSTLNDWCLTPTLAVFQL